MPARSHGSIQAHGGSSSLDGVMFAGVEGGVVLFSHSLGDVFWARRGGQLSVCVCVCCLHPGYTMLSPPRGTAPAAGTSGEVKSHQRQEHHPAPAAAGDGVGIVLLLHVRRLRASSEAALALPAGTARAQRRPEAPESFQEAKGKQRARSKRGENSDGGGLIPDVITSERQRPGLGLPQVRQSSRLLTRGVPWKPTWINARGIPLLWKSIVLRKQEGGKSRQGWWWCGGGLGAPRAGCADL